MKFAAGIADITPHTPIALAGRGGAVRLADRVSSRLEANVIVIRESRHTIVLATLDTLFCSMAFHDALIKRLAESHDFVADAVFLLASHTHNAPSLDPSKPGLGAMDDFYFSASVDSLAAKIHSVNASNFCSIEFRRSSHAVEKNSRRRKKTLRFSAHWPFVSLEVCLVPSALPEIHHQLDLIVAIEKSGRAVFCLWTWPCHTTTHFRSLDVSSDFPDSARQALRKLLKNENLPVLYFPGFAGDIRADIVRKPIDWRSRMMTPFVRPFAVHSEESSKLLAKSLIEAIEICFKNLCLPQPMNYLNYQTTSVGLSSIMENCRHKGVIGLHKLSFGSLTLVLMGAETCSSWHELMQVLFPLGTVFSGYCNDVPCYLPTQDQVREGGYEVDGFRHSFGVDGCFSANMEEIVIEHLSQLSLDRALTQT